jgi:hypothetical protein
MKKLLSICILMLSLSSMASTLDILKSIANGADVANGSADVKQGPSFNDRAGSQFQQYWKARWNNCKFSAPYATKEKALSSLLAYSNDKATVDAIKKLDAQKRIAKIYGFETDHDIACSQVWVNVYTIDGYVLELWYGLGD